MSVPSSRGVMFVSEGVLADFLSGKAPQPLANGPLPTKGIFKSAVMSRVSSGPLGLSPAGPFLGRPFACRPSGSFLCGEEKGEWCGVSVWACPEVHLRDKGSSFQMSDLWILWKVHLPSGWTHDLWQGPSLERKSRKLGRRSLSPLSEPASPWDSEGVPEQRCPSLWSKRSVSRWPQTFVKHL